MTDQEIQNYEYCKKHLKEIKGFKESLPHNHQMHGCGSQAPSIEHSLDKTHREMHESILIAYDVARDKIQGMIKKI